MPVSTAALTNAQMIAYFQDKLNATVDLDPIAAETDEEIAVWINQALYEIGSLLNTRSFREAITVTSAETDLTQFNIYAAINVWLENGVMLQKFDLKNAEHNVWNQTTSATPTQWFQNGSTLCLDPVPTGSVNLLLDAFILPDGIDPATPNAKTNLTPLLHRPVVNLAVARACEQTATEAHQIRAIEKMIADAYGAAKLVQRQNHSQQMPRPVKNWARKTIS